MNTMIFSLKYSDEDWRDEKYEHLLGLFKDKYFVDIIQYDENGRVYEQFNGAFIENEKELLNYINEFFNGGYTHVSDMALISNEITELLEIKEFRLINVVQ